MKQIGVRNSIMMTHTHAREKMTRARACVFVLYYYIMKSLTLRQLHRSERSKTIAYTHAISCSFTAVDIALKYIGLRNYRGDIILLRRNKDTLLTRG